MKARLCVALIVFGIGCSSEPAGNNDTPDSGTETDTGGRRDMGGGETDMGDEPDLVRLDMTMADSGGDTGTDNPPTLMETEPNDGTELDEVNDLPVAERLGGALTAGDADIFRVPTQAGSVYKVVLESNNIEDHITVIDNGRNGDSPGEDYVKIARGDTLQFVAMGEGGHLVVVRDSRNVDGAMVGGDDFTYVVEVRELDPADVTQGALTFGEELTGALAVPSDVHLWTFDGTLGMDVLFDMSMPNGDGRLFVVADATNDWIARQDNRSAGDPNPLLDAPLTEQGAMWLVVEDITESGPPSSYSIQTGP